MLVGAMPELGKIILRVYGEDEILTRNHRKASSRPIPGRVVNGVWSTLHERGNRKLISMDEIDAHTWVRNAYNAWTMQFMDTDSLGSSSYAAGALGMKTTSGSVGAFATPVDIGAAGVSNQGFRAGAANALSGIQAGKGDGAGAAAAYSFEDYVLEDLIEEGTTSGDEFNYVAMDDYTTSLVTYSSLVWSNAIQRFMNNNSGSSITVEEVALVASPVQGSQYLMARDVLGGDAKVVANTGQFDCTYTVKSPTFPA